MNSELEDKAVAKAKASLAEAYKCILAATSTIPREVAQGSYQRAVQWKKLAKKWIVTASKGVPKTTDIQELSNLASEANQALTQLKSGS